MINSVDYVAHDNVFTKDEIIAILKKCEGQTLGALDRINVFARTIANPKITGIAGDVVEQSILGMAANSKQEPDLLIDGVEIELKTTGLRVDKKNAKEYDAKEPVTITAVSINRIVGEDDFDRSTLWHKLNKILFVYYLYDSETTVLASGYQKFKVLSHQFYEPSALDKARFESDWIIVRDFLRNAPIGDLERQNYYPLLSTNINHELVVLDTAPKYPNAPRFRIRRAYFTIIVKNHFVNKLEILDTEYHSFEELDDKLHEITDKYHNMLVGELVPALGISTKKITKQVAEQVIVRMFGGNAKKLNKVEIFEAFGIVGYSITLSVKNGRTEDTKMCPIDFDEIIEDKPFEESEFYQYYHDNKFLFFVLQEMQIASRAKSKEVTVEFEKNKFLGFKRLSFSEKFIYEQVKPVWERIRYLIKNAELINVPDVHKDGNIVHNKNGTVKGAPNFPKSSDGVIFVRGTSNNSSVKPLTINGVSMYRQNLWIRGIDILMMLNEKEFI